MPETWDELKKLGAALNGKGIVPVAYPAGQDRNFPIFPFYTFAGGLKPDKLLREADLGSSRGPARSWWPARRSTR